MGKLFEQGADIDPILTNRVAQGLLATATTNSTWGKIVIWLRTALQDATHRFITDTDRANWDLIKQTIINIGDWDMNATASLIVAHSLDVTKIRGVRVIIISDVNGVGGNTVYYDFFSPGGSIGIGKGTTGMEINTNDITLYQDATCPFISTSFDATPYNRGYIIIDTTP